MRSFLFTIVSLILVSSGQAAVPSRPNVLFIAIDDLRPALGCYGDVHARTPHLDRLAARSLRLDRAYCNQAVCAPSRNALMTGLRPQTLGIYDLSTNFRDARPEAVTLAQHFRSQGYQTTAVGKILHTGHGNHDDLASWSEKPFHPKADYYALEENRPSTAEGGSRGAGVFGAATEGADVPDDTYADGITAAESVKRLAALKSAGRPFFLATGFRCPHLPFVAPKKYWDGIDADKLPLSETDALPEGSPAFAGPSTDEIRKYKQIPQVGQTMDAELKRRLIHGYYAATSYVDACVGRVLEALDASGLADSTIVVVWGDHGYHLGDHGSWGKHTNFETAARIPLMIAMPGRKGAATSALVETVDIYPTLAALAGLPAPQGLDGKSFVTLMDDPGSKFRDHVTHVYPRNQLLGRAVRDDRYRLVEWNKIGGAPEKAVYELFDYEADPQEHRNLAAERPEVLGRLKSLLAAQPEPRPQIKAMPKSAPDAAPAAAAAGEMTREEMFKGKDKNGDGKLTREEFLRNQRDPKEAPKRFDRFDTDGDGVLSLEEFVKAGAAGA